MSSRRWLSTLGVAVACGAAGAALAGAPGGDREPRPGQGSGQLGTLGGAPPRGAPSGSAETPRSRLPASHRPARGRPVGRIEIPAITVSAPVIELGLNRDRSLQVPAKASEAGWWTGGPFPGRRGAAVIAAHVDSVDGPGAFFRLRDLRPGDEVFVSSPARGRTRFVVERSESHPKDRFPTLRVYRRTREPTLRLITCAGRFDERRGRYDTNLVVFARRG